MEQEARNRKLTYAFLAVLATVSVLALGVLLRGCSGRAAASARPASDPARPKRAWPDQAGPQVLDPSMLANDADESSIALVHRPADSAKGQEIPTDAAAGKLRPPGSGAPSVPGGAWGPAAGSKQPELDAREKGLLTGLVGGELDADRAVGLGGARDGTWAKVMKTLGKYPKILGYVLNNEYVVKGFMSVPRAKKYCQNAGAFKSYLMNPGGRVSKDMDVFDAVTHGHKDGPGVVFASKMADALMGCPSVNALKTDKAAISEIAQANPRLVQTGFDPTLLMGALSNPRVSAAAAAIKADLKP